jgi:hypothetical protein
MKGKRPMLLFDESKALENALGAEAASALARVFENLDEIKLEMASKMDVRELRAEMNVRFGKLESEMNVRFSEMDIRFSEMNIAISRTQGETLKWMMGIAMAQLAVIVAVVAVVITLLK